MKNIKIKVVINDTTGTLISGAWKNPDCKIGLIIGKLQQRLFCFQHISVFSSELLYQSICFPGTGTNACYVEKQKCAQLFNHKNHGSNKVLINTEWGAFGDDGALDFIRTKYDVELDSRTINPGRQLYV